MLDFDGDVEETFGQTFEIQLQAQTGERVPFQLKPQGDEIPVTSENRRGTPFL